MNIFLSQPMSGLTEEEIITNRSKAIERLYQYMKNIPSFWPDEWKISVNCKVLDNLQFTDCGPLQHLSADIAIMSEAQLLFAIEGWELARGCRVEHKIAEEYGLYIIEEKDGKVIYIDPTRTFLV